MSFLQKVVDEKVEDLKIFSDKGLELGDRLSVLVTEEKKEDELNDDDLELLFDIKLLNNVITNKIISILELKYLSEEMSEDLNLDEFVKIPNVIEFETTYKNFKENHIKEIADKYKNQIPIQLYNALYNYKVEITD